MIERCLIHDGGHSVVDYGGREGERERGGGRERRVSEREGEKEREVERMGERERTGQ